MNKIYPPQFLKTEIGGNFGYMQNCSYKLHSLIRQNKLKEMKLGVL